MLNWLKYFCVLCSVFVFTNTVLAASCATGYDVMAHDIDLDFNINTKLPDAVTASTKALNTNTFILSDDGNCYSGYEPYAKTGDIIYPLIEDSDLCADGYYRANGNCVAYTSGGCPTGRYNAAVNNASFVASEDGNCYSGFDSYTRTDDYIYPLVDSEILCPAGQYMANGTCTSYSVGTCPENHYKYNIDNNTMTEMVDNACPTNYTEYTMDFVCDVHPEQDLCADIPTIINLNWYDRDTIIATNTCRYGQPITLPPEPTRPGYIFSGWRLRTEQNSGE